MTGSSVARRYASALYSVASRLQEVDRVATDLDLITSTFRENQKLQDVLKLPTVTEAAQKSIVEKLFGQLVHSASLQFLYLLIEKRRVEVLDSILSSFIRISDEKRNIQRAVVTSAVALTEPEIEQVRQKIADMTGRQVVLEARVDPGIIGGLLLKIGDRVLDGSVQGQLRRLHQTLSGQPPRAGA